MEFKIGGQSRKKFGKGKKKKKKKVEHVDSDEDEFDYQKSKIVEDLKKRSKKTKV